MRVRIYTEGGSEVGYGHLMRCAGLYDAVRERGWQCEFVVNGDDSLAGVLEGRSFLLRRWDKDSGADSAASNEEEVAVIDSYLAPEAVYKQIAKRVSLVVSIDDFGRLAYPPGIVVRAGAIARTLPGDGAPGVDYLRGPSYHLLRREFWDVPARGAPGRDVRCTLLTMGGSSPLTVLVETARLMARQFPRAMRTAIIGRSQSATGEALRRTDHDLMLHEGAAAATMVMLMQAADLAVTAGGQTLNELARCGVPSVSVAISTNQEDHARGFDERGVTVFAGSLSDRSLMRSIEASLVGCQSSKERSAMASSGPALIDGNGPRRIVEFVAARGAPRPAPADSTA